jgi:hypothetical protein
MASAAFVRVVYGSKSTNVDLDARIRTFSDIAEAAALKHLGNRFPAEFPIGALSLRGPIAAASKDSALAALAQAGVVEFSEGIDCDRMTKGSWFLLQTDASVAGGDMLSILEAMRIFYVPSLAWQFYVHSHFVLLYL